MLMITTTKMTTMMMLPPTQNIDIPFFWKAWLSIKQPITADDPIHPAIGVDPA
jgi:hypothetical protein